MVCGKYSLKSLKYEKLSKLNLLTIDFFKGKISERKIIFNSGVPTISICNAKNVLISST